MSAPSSAVPYKRTAVFDENTLPAALRREHRTKPGVWGVIRVLDGRLRYQVLDPPSDVILERGHAGLVRPDEPHLVKPIGPMRMQVEFYKELPDMER
jgi:tellurite resistance-related uncharacterized protein